LKLKNKKGAKKMTTKNIKKLELPSQFVNSEMVDWDKVEEFEGVFVKVREVTVHDDKLLIYDFLNNGKIYSIWKRRNLELPNDWIGKRLLIKRSVNQKYGKGKGYKYSFEVYEVAN